MDTMVRTHVLLPKKLLTEVDSRIGEGKRSETITALLSDWLRREQLMEAFEAVVGSEPPKDVPPEWLSTEGSVEWVRAQRRVQSPRERRIQAWIDEQVGVTGEAP